MSTGKTNIITYLYVSFERIHVLVCRFFTCFVSFFLFSLQLMALEPGQIDLRRKGNTFSIETREASLDDVLSAIDEATLPNLRFSDVPDRTVTVRYQNVDLDELLAKFDVSYVLSYDPFGQRLLSGWVAGGIGLNNLFADIMVPGISVDWMERTIDHIQGLRSDDVPFNAMNSMWALYADLELAVPYLERALHQDDYQMQQFAAHVLMELPDHYDASYRLLEVMVEGLADDQYPYGMDERNQFRYSSVRNAQKGLKTFLDHPAWVNKATPALAEALHSHDGQQRFLSAIVLAEHRKTEYLHDIVRVLFPHLADNRLPSDAGMAQHALLKLGAKGKPLLQEVLGQGDEQQDRYVRRILEFDGVVDWDFPLRSMIGWEQDLFPK